MGHQWRAGGAARYAMIAALAVAAGFGCARNVAQHGHSGKDQAYKGAKEIELEDGEGRSRDIVTYPGGDRVDWKVIRLPEDQKGKLELKLKISPARPGLDVAFDVYDEWFHRVGRAKPASRGTKKTKKVTIDQARGTYYVQIYAPQRTDAAAYTLRVHFREQSKPQPAGPMLAAIGDPPPLPAVPAPKPIVDPPVPSVAPGADPGNPAAPGGATVAAPAPAVEPIKASITALVDSTGGVILTVNRGKKHGVAQGWTGTVLIGSSSSPLDGGEFKIIKVSDRESVAKAKLSVDQFQNNRHVLLTPP